MWPSGLRRWFKAPVISMAWVRIPPLPFMLHVSVVGVSEVLGDFETSAVPLSMILRAMIHVE